MAHDEALKNHCGGVKDKPSNKKEARIYEMELTAACTFEANSYERIITTG